MAKRKSILHIYLFSTKLFLFWIAYYLAGKIIFLGYQTDKSAELSFGEIATAIFRGLRLDISMASYLVALGFALSALLLFIPRILKKSIDWAHYIFITLFSFLQVANLELYRNWGFHIDTSPLLYIDTPKEMLASVPLFNTLMLVFFASILSAISIFSYKRFVSNKPLPPVQWYWSPLLLLSAGLMFIPIRGGFGIIALNSGSVYFSNKQFANHVAVNPIWNFQYSISKYSRLSKSHRYMPDSSAKAIFNNWNIQGGEITQLLQNQHPNIAIIVLESFTSKIVGAVGGENNVTPHLNALAKESVLFTNLYSTADRSDKGLVAIFSGIPALPTLSMNKFPQKTIQFPSLVKPFNQHGYANTFYYGGNINFANLKSYLMNVGFENFVTMNDFTSDKYGAKWGVHDQFMFDKFYTDLTATKQPFFKAFFTLSCHEPFDVPMKDKFSGTEENKFRNAAYYTDSCLGAFFDKIKSEPVWDSTLFILIADHGSRLPNKDELSSPTKYQIPMLWLGGALRAKDTVISTYMSQHDVVATLLGQLPIAPPELPFSRNALSANYKAFGFYTYNNGFGFVTDSIKQVRDNTSGTYYKQEGCASQKDSLAGLAYLQNVWLYFMSK